MVAISYIKLGKKLTLALVEEISCVLILFHYIVSDKKENVFIHK